MSNSSNGRFSFLEFPAVFHPVRGFLVGRAELPWVGGVDALGDKTLKDFGLPKFIKGLQSIPRGGGRKVAVFPFLVGVGKVE